MVRWERHRLGHVKFAMPLHNGRAKPGEAQGKAMKEASLVFLKLLTFGFFFFGFLPSLLPIFRSCFSILPRFFYFCNDATLLLLLVATCENLFLQLLYFVYQNP